MRCVCNLLQLMHVQISRSLAGMGGCIESDSEPTHKQLAAEPQAEVSVSRSLQEAEGELVHLQGGLLHVALCPHVVPLPVIQGQVGVHGQDRWTVSHVKGERHHRGSWTDTHTHTHRSG